ncbi:glycosyl hydrolase family 18 protein [Kibdelosporangium phytohabitans]|uniref:chitinase n=1 Tax=Kibdelosporangium phytohabitans TaxID=860235 RepID=A0A0N9IBM1_9PSEU|nr:glycosyl hydrolase family 18 protein [Kibdelosporangium phytohabitans]ALG11899.1 chitinase [Kibdelosporangium phytohabitans]MBE1463346.1 hypothetical protein [Kibdelosporangium phytohabitans]
MRRLFSLVATVSTAIGLTVATAAPASAAALPAHVFAPYFEAWTGESPAALAQQSGAKHLTMAFLQTATAGSCTAYWNGDPGMPIAASTFGNDIKTIKSRGGDVIPSFGGYTATTTGTEIADSCGNVSQIAAVFQNVITTYDISRIDLDIEADSLNNAAGIDRRNKAIKQVEDWAAANGRTIQFSYTLPTTTQGLAESGLAVLRNAVTNNARVDVVNLMTFDYYDNQPHDMARDTQTAAEGLVRQLGALYPGKTPAQLWAMVGITEMIGIDDFGPAETFTTANAVTVYNWAVAKGINTLSFWALQRDNGNCPGTGGRDDCSGVAQETWQFSRTFAPFTGENPNPGNDFAVTLNPSSGAVNPGAATSAAISTTVTSGTAQTVTFSVAGTPPGVTAAVSPSSVTAGGSATLNISTTTAAPPGSYPLTITATSPAASHTVVYTVTVNGSSPSGGILNAGFESGALTPWSGQGDTVVSTPTHSGTKSLQVNATGSSTGQASQAVTLEPNKSYTLKAWVQGNFAYLGVSGGATASAWTSSSGWKQLSVPFTTGSSGAVTVYVHGWYGQGTVYADDFSIS